MTKRRNRITPIFRYIIFKIQNLSSSFQIKQMISHSIRLNFSMKLVDIMSHSQKNAFCSYILLSSAKISAESHVLFNISKGAFYLNAAVHSQLTALFTDDSFHIFFSALHKLFRNLKNLVSFLKRYLAVVSFDTVSFKRTI